MTAQEIYDLIQAREADCSLCDMYTYGIRKDRAGLEVGHLFDNSHQWWQDDPAEWGEECEYNEELGFWDGGELDGVCTIGLSDWPTAEEIERKVKMADFYLGEALYLVGGDWAEGGNDNGESIIHNGVCIAVI